MKKIIVLTFILLVTILAISGCGSTSTETVDRQQQVENPEPKKEKVENSGIPQPPALPEE